MPEPRPIPVEVCRRWIEALKRTDISFYEVGSLFQEEYPDIFSKEMRREAVHERLRRYSVKHGLEIPKKRRLQPPKPTLRYFDEVPELVFPYQDRLIVISDLHASAHDTAVLDLALKVIEGLEITAAVFNGDQLDNAYIGHKGVRDRFAAPYEENLEQFIQVANMLKEAGLQRQFVIQGNHDDKPLRQTDGELTYPLWWKAHIADHLDDPDSYQVTHRYYCIMEPEKRRGWPFPDGHRNFPWYFMHQQEYSKIPLRVGNGHASKFLANICTGHQHHLATGWHDSHKLKLADAGTFQHKHATGYKVNRPSKHPEWNPGFLTLIDNKVHLHEVV